MIYPRVRYEMIDLDRGKFIDLTDDPKGWDKSESTLKRSTKTFGIFTELSKNLEFTNDGGADFLRIGWLNKEIEARIILKEFRSHPRQDSEYLHSTGHFDFSKYEADDLSVKVPFKSGGMQSVIKAQMKTKFELERLESVNNKPIDALAKTTLALEGRQIFLTTTWDSDEANLLIGSAGNQNFHMETTTNAGNTRSNTNAFPFRIKGQSHEPYAVSPAATFESQLNVLNASQSDRMNFLINNQQRVIKLTINYNFAVWFPRYEEVQWGRYYLSLTIYDTNYNVIRRFLIEELYSPRVGTTIIGNGSWYNDIKAASAAPIQRGVLPQDKHSNQSFTVQMTGSYIKTFTLEDGESWGIETLLRTDMYFDNSAKAKAFIQNNTSTLKIEEESYAPPSTTPVVLFHEAGEKLTQIITGLKLKFRSNFYGRIDLGYKEDGVFAYTTLTTGLWVRGFIDSSLEFSMGDYLDTSNAIHNTGYAVININGEEIFIVEDMKYFFRQETLIILPNQIDKIKRSAATNLYYASGKFGYKKPAGDNLYEEAAGLDEYNIDSGYAFPITRVETVYTKISPARADGIGQEFARRKGILDFPDTDTRYDKSVFLNDCKKGFGLSLEQRLWQDDYIQEPTGVFSPATATNLRLTPRENMERHQWFFGSGLKVFKEKYITHSPGKSNSFLGTRKAGQDEKLIRDNVLISDFERARFKNEYLEFDYVVDYDVNRQLFGSTEINGELVPNYYGKVQILNDKGLKEYGYIVECKPNSEGKWKLLKAI